jgi:hypothetical protein
MVEPLWDEDAGDRLTRRLAKMGVAFRANFADAAKIAGRQLESIKPAVTAAGRQGVYLGSAAAVDAGAIVIVLADAERVFTMQVKQVVGFSRAEMLGALIERTKKESGRRWGATETLHAMQWALRAYGGPPGEEPGRRHGAGGKCGRSRSTASRRRFGAHFIERRRAGEQVERSGIDLQ